MYKIAIDTHTHTIFSRHAFCTIGELWTEAAEARLEGFGVTDHMGRMFTQTNGDEIDTHTLFVNYSHVSSQVSLPRIRKGVKLYRSVELCIDSKDGSLFGQDVKDDGSVSYIHNGDGNALTSMFLSGLDYVIAGVHSLREYPSKPTESEGTSMYINAMTHPKVFILAHIYHHAFDIDEVVKVAKAMGKAIELNEAKLGWNVDQRAREIMIRCAEIGTMISVGSDAHSFGQIGVFPKSLTMLKEIGFPEELIVNGNMERFEKAINFRA